MVAVMSSRETSVRRIAPGGKKMVLSYCNGCKYLEKVEINGENHSRCQKENCLSVYTKCVSEEAVRQFIHNDQMDSNRWVTSALEICYQVE